MEKNENSYIKNIELLHDLSEEKYNFLMGNIDKLDQKFTTLFSVNAIIISIIFSLYKARQTTLFFVGLAFILVAIGIAVLGYYPKEFGDIDIEKFWNDNKSEEYETTIIEITDTIIKVYTKNRSVQGKKSKYVKLAFIFSLTGIISIVLSQIITC